MPFIVSARNTFFRMAGTVKATIKYFVFGTNSGLLYTIDVNNTTAQISGFNTGGSAINDIEYIPSTNTTLVAANDGKLFSSTDLTSWTTINTGITNNIRVVKSGVGKNLDNSPTNAIMIGS